MERIAAQSQRAGQILGGFRRMIRKQPPERRPADVHGLIVQALDLMQADLRRFRIQTHAQLDAQTFRAVCDEVEIGQVLVNLLQNAVDAAAARTGVREVTITTRSDEETITVVIRNSGQVLPSGRSDRAFEPFFSTKPDGLGIGLNISRTIVEAHGGHLLLRANAQGGATSEFTLPAIPADHRQPESAALPEVPA
jgi:C4-dicarboxylate-specific signal transduction histidine kinase